MKIKNIAATFIPCLLFFTIISCSKSGSTSSGSTGTGVNVDMNNMLFSPSTITVKVGTPVKWNNSDYYSAHTVTSNDGTSFNSGSIAIGGSFSFTPATVGTFPYHCTIHAGMTGTLIVTN